MNSKLISAAIALALALPAAGTAAAATKRKAAEAAPPAIAVATQDELKAVREQLQALAERLQKLEQSNHELEQQNAALKAQTAKVASTQAESEKSNDAQADAIAKATAKVNAADWAGKIKIAGDFRYRNEQIKRDLRTDQMRDRIRARIGITAKANDTLSVSARLATGADDPRSPNQTIGAADTGEARRAIGIDQYFVTWKPIAGLSVVGGKMAYPYWRAGQSLLNDGDFNPEGLAANYTNGVFFGNAFGFWITERGNANFNPATGVASSIGLDKQGTIYGGLQLGAKFALNSDTILTAAAMYTSLGAGKGRIPYWFAGGSIPTTTTATSSACTVLPCTPTITLKTANNIGAITQAANGNSVDANGGLLYDFKVTQLSADLSSKVAGVPVQVFAEFAKNSEANNGEDKAFTAGFLIGKASEKNTWEFGYAYEKLEKDSYFAAFVDSDFGAGLTDTKGSIIRLGYAPAKNWTVNATYFINKLNVSGLSNVAAQSATLFKQEEEYKRLQLDFNVKY